MNFINGGGFSPLGGLGSQMPMMGIGLNLNIGFNMMDSLGLSGQMGETFSRNPLASMLGGCSPSMGMNGGMGMMPGFGGCCNPSGSMFGGLMQGIQQQQQMMMMMMQIMMMMMMMQQQNQMMNGMGGGMPGMQGLSGGSPCSSGCGQATNGASGAPSSGGSSSPGTGSSAPIPGQNAGLPQPTGSSGTASGGRVPVDKYPAYAGRPHGLDAIKKMFGEPGKNQVTVEMPAGKNGKMIKVTCHKLIADRMKAAFQEVKDRGLSHLIDSFDGSYNNRNKRGGSTKSIHAWGIGFDVNASQNGMGKSTQTPAQKQLAQVFAKYGFYQLPNDPMHFQFATGY